MMGSCFRVGKKKNSYTVTQLDEEYSSGSGSYRGKQVTKYPTSGKVQSKQTKASPAVHNGNDRLPAPDVVSTPQKVRSPSTTSTVSVRSEGESGKVAVTTKSVHVEEVQAVRSHTPGTESVQVASDPAPEAQFMSPTYPDPEELIVEAPEEVRGETRDEPLAEPETSWRRDEDSAQLTVEYTHQESTESEPADHDHRPQPSDLRQEPSDSDSDRGSMGRDPVLEPGLEMPAVVVESQVTFKDTPETITYTPQVTVDEDEESNEYEEDEEQFSATPYQDAYETTASNQTVEHMNVVSVGGAPIYSMDQAKDEVEITDSPAGTWDARLNTEVRAELDEVRRSQSSSRASSTGSLDTGAAQHSEGPAAHAEYHTEYQTEDLEGGVTVTTSYTHTEYSSEGPTYYSTETPQSTMDDYSAPLDEYSTETHEYSDPADYIADQHTNHEAAHLHQDDSLYDNEHNEQLAASEFQAPGTEVLGHGEIVLNDVIYDDPGPAKPHSDDGF